MRTVGATIVMLCSFVYSDQPALTYVFLIVPIVCLCCLCCLVLFVVAALRKRPSRSPWVLLALITFLVVAGTLLTAQGVLRPSLRWLLWSHRLKAEVLTQPTTANGELKHVEWDGFGGAPVGDWTIYVVFDPTDSLSVAAKDDRSGSYRGIPCEVELCASLRKPLVLRDARNERRVGPLRLKHCCCRQVPISITNSPTLNLASGAPLIPGFGMSGIRSIAIPNQLT